MHVIRLVFYVQHHIIIAFLGIYTFFINVSRLHLNRSVIVLKQFEAVRSIQSTNQSSSHNLRKPLHIIIIHRLEIVENQAAIRTACHIIHSFSHFITTKNLEFLVKLNIPNRYIYNAFFTLRWLYNRTQLGHNTQTRHHVHCIFNANIYVDGKF